MVDPYVFYDLGETSTALKVANLPEQRLRRLHRGRHPLRHRLRRRRLGRGRLPADAWCDRATRQDRRKADCACSSCCSPSSERPRHARAGRQGRRPHGPLRRRKAERRRRAGHPIVAASCREWQIPGDGAERGRRRIELSAACVPWEMSISTRIAERPRGPAIPAGKRRFGAARRRRAVRRGARGWRTPLVGV